MQRLFWPVESLDEMQPQGRLAERLSLWAEDWLPSVDTVSHEIRSSSAIPGDGVFALLDGDRFLAAAWFNTEVRDSLLKALPKEQRDGADREADLLGPLAEKLLLDLRHEVFGLESSLDVKIRPRAEALPQEFARISFNGASGQQAVAWCSADFLMTEPAAESPSIDTALREKIAQDESAELCATLGVSMTMRSLLELADGDVVPLTPLDDSPLVLRISGQAVCSAYLGSAAGQKALVLVDGAGER